MIVAFATEETHEGPATVHCKFTIPEMFVSCNVEALGFTIVAVPLRMVQVPVPYMGVTAKTAVAVAQPISIPAVKAGETAAYCVTVTLELLEGHPDFDTVHCKTTTPLTPVIVLVGEDGVVIVAVPFTKVHRPVPDEGTFP